MRKASGKPFDRPGCKPGNDKAISQRKAIDMGYEAAPTRRTVRTNQEMTATGRAKVPGLRYV